MTAVRGVWARSTLARSLAWAVLAAVGDLLVVRTCVSAYNDLQLATGAYYFAALAGLTVLAGQSGQISLGHGALMAVGAYTVALLIGDEGWALVPAIAAAVVVSVLVGIPVGAAASRLRGPYLAGATLAFAVGLPALADKFSGAARRRERARPSTRRCRRRGWAPTSRSSAGRRGSRAPERWWCCSSSTTSSAAASGRSMRAVRDDEIAASLSGLSVGRTQTIAFIISAGCAGLGGAMLAVVLQLAQPGAFPLQLSLSLLTGVVLGGLGSLVGAIWGAALLTLLPNWTNDIAHSFSLSTKVSANMPLAIYGIVLIVAMILWPSGIQGGLRALFGRLRTARGPA